MTALGRLLGINSHTLTSRMRGIIRKDLAYSDKGKIYLTDKGREVFEILEKGFAEGLDLFLKAALKDYVTRSGGIVSEDSEEYKKTPLG